MKIFDVNILIYAHREDQLDHDFYKSYIEDLVNSGESIGLSPLSGVGFVRIVTHSRFPGGPTGLAQAMSVIDALSDQPNCNWIYPGRRHWSIVSDLCRQKQCRGKLVADAQHAALAIEHGGIWVTRDFDFKGFCELGLRLEYLVPSAGG